MKKSRISNKKTYKTPFLNLRIHTIISFLLNSELANFRKCIFSPTPLVNSLQTRDMYGMVCNTQKQKLPNDEKLQAFSSLEYTRVKKGTHLEGFYEHRSLNLPHQKNIQSLLESYEKQMGQMIQDMEFYAHMIQPSRHNGDHSRRDAWLGFHR